MLHLVKNVQQHWNTQQALPEKIEQKKLKQRFENFMPNGKIFIFFRNTKVKLFASYADLILPNSKNFHSNKNFHFITNHSAIDKKYPASSQKRANEVSNRVVLNTIVPNFFCMFGSTYVYESTFSSLTRRKNKFRSSLSQ